MTLIKHRHLAGLAALVIATISGASADVLHLNGTMQSSFKLTTRNVVTVPDGMEEIHLNVPLRRTLSVGPNKQTVLDTGTDSTVVPDQQTVETDGVGNKFVSLLWKHPHKGTITVTTVANMVQAVDMSPVGAADSFPLVIRNLPKDVQAYLKDSDLTKPNRQISQLAYNLTTPARNEIEAVENIQKWLIGNIHYNGDQSGTQTSAGNTFAAREGKCDGFAHLFIAMLRSQGIPARFVGGFQMPNPLTFRANNSEITLSADAAAHSWCEVYYPSLGWQPYDPQDQSMWVDTRHIRLYAGVDSDDSLPDLTWVKGDHVRASPELDTQWSWTPPRDTNNLWVALSRGGGRHESDLFTRTRKS